LQSRWPRLFSRRSCGIPDTALSTYQVKSNTCAPPPLHTYRVRRPSILVSLFRPHVLVVLFHGYPVSLTSAIFNLLLFFCYRVPPPWISPHLQKRVFGACPRLHTCSSCISYSFNRTLRLWHTFPPFFPPFCLRLFSGVTQQRMVVFFFSDILFGSGFFLFVLGLCHSRLYPFRRHQSLFVLLTVHCTAINHIL